MDFLFSTAIADVAKNKKAPRRCRRAFRVRRLERFGFRRFGRLLPSSGSGRLRLRFPRSSLRTASARIVYDVIFEGLFFLFLPFAGR